MEIKILSAFLIIFSLVGLFKLIFDMNQKTKKDLLDDLFKKGHITSETYKKFIK